jgi:hypothetical protein
MLTTLKQSDPGEETRGEETVVSLELVIVATYHGISATVSTTY